MKKTVTIVSFILFSIFLVACEATNTLSTEILEKIEIGYAVGDQADHVTGDITLPITLDGYTDLTITWTSSQPTYIVIENTVGKVNRQTNDVSVTLTAKVVYGIGTKDIPFELTVIGIDINEPDTNKPVITGAKDINFTIGDVAPDYLVGITATDAVDGALTVNVDSSAVNLAVKGVYNIVYTATDAAGNKTEVTVKITVKAVEVPVIVETLVHHFQFTGDLQHGYSDDKEASVLKDTVSNSNVNVLKKRANTTGNELVISGASTSDTIGWVVFNFTPAIHKVTFNVKSWSSFDLEATTVAKVQTKVGNNWVDVLDLMPVLGLEILTIEIKDIDVDNLRFYVEGNIGSQNTARINISELKMFNVTGSTPVDPIPGDDVTPPVISGAKDITYVIGQTAPNYLAGVTALDNVDGIVQVSVDATDVDLQTIGIYDLIYFATDASGNLKEVIVQVYVEEQVSTGEGVTSVETFATLSLAGSNYVGGSFIGINGIAWTYAGARGDEALNGPALTFGGRTSDNSSLKATIQNGIQSISVSYRKPFSNSQDYGIYVNGNLVGTFTATDVPGTFSQTLSAPVIGEFILEIKPIAATDQRRQITIDDLTWVSAPVNQKPVEQQNAESDRNALSVPSTFIENVVTSFPSTGEKGSMITWSFLNPEDTNNSNINFTTGQITVPSNGQLTVGVVALIKNATFEYEKVFTIKLGEGDATSVLDARNTTNQSYVKTIGTISSMYSNETTTFIFLQDDTAGVLVQVPLALGSTIAVGDEVEVKGTKLTENASAYIGVIRGITKLGTKTVTPLVLTSNQLNSNSAKLISIFGLISKNYSNTVTNYVLHTNQGSFEVNIPSDLNATDKLAIQNKLANLDAGIHVSVVAPVAKLGSVSYLLVTNVNQLIVDNTVDFNNVSSIILDNAILPTVDATISRDLNLSTDSNLLFGATISWMSSNPSVLGHDGHITQGEDDVVVTLTYTITFDDEVVHTKTYQVTVLAISSFEGYYAVLSGLSGSALTHALTSLIKTTGQATGSTNQVKTVDTFEGKNYNIYTGFGTYGNREHVWPNSKLGSAPDYDLHNLRAAVVSVNSARSNFPFTNSVIQTSWEKIGSTFYPGTEHVGDVARIVLYISVRYGLNLNLVGNLQMFLTWHEADPVSPFEISRNGKIQEIQKSRNPFIDHPELVGVLFS